MRTLALHRRGGEPPPGFDTPFPKLPSPGPIAFVPMPRTL